MKECQASGDADDADSRGMNKHHTLPKSRIRSLNRERLLRRRGAKRVDKCLHDAYHNIFRNSFPWEVVKILKCWAKKQRKKKNGTKTEPFYDGFSQKQFESFVLLFGCQPDEFKDNGHLNHAISVIEENFFAPQDVFWEYVEVINGNDKKKE